MGFLVHLDPFSFPAYRRCFVADLDGAIVAFAGVIPVPAREGWFIEDVVRGARAPNGTAELLTDAVMTWTAEQGSDWLTLGLAPLAGDVTGLLRLARTGTSLLYDFEGLRRYKEKLRPTSWSPIYVLYPPAQSAASTIIDMLTAFSRGGLLRFGLRTLQRGPTAIIRLLAVLLIPWTLVLATPVAAPWFPTALVRWAWVAFDAVVAVALLRLLQKPSRRMVTALAIATLLDAVLTVGQAAAWNVERVSSVTDVVIIVSACLAPLAATALLWGARHARLRA
jgi:phosphatidylglycerol lysyltransferase